MALTSDQIAALEKLAALLKSGAIAEVDFADLKNRIMETADEANGQPPSAAMNPVQRQSEVTRARLKISETDQTLIVNRRLRPVRQAVEAALRSLDLSASPVNENLILTTGGTWRFNGCRAYISITAKNDVTVINFGARRTTLGRQSCLKLYNALTYGIRQALEEAELQVRNTSEVNTVEDLNQSEAELIRNAALITIEAGIGSTSLLQRRLKVGFARACRIMDILEEHGVVGPASGSKGREVLVTLEECQQLDFGRDL
jgi:hypothetical protein